MCEARPFSSEAGKVSLPKTVERRASQTTPYGNDEWGVESRAEK